MSSTEFSLQTLSAKLCSTALKRKSKFRNPSLLQKLTRLDCNLTILTAWSGALCNQRRRSRWSVSAVHKIHVLVSLCDPMWQWWQLPTHTSLSAELFLTHKHSENSTLPALTHTHCCYRTDALTWTGNFTAARLALSHTLTKHKPNGFNWRTGVIVTQVLFIQKLFWHAFLIFLWVDAPGCVWD